MAQEDRTRQTVAALDRVGTANLPGLVWTLVRTDFKARYHGTMAGFFWALGKPLAMFFVLMAVFSFVFRSDPDYRLNLIVGLFLWDFFAEGTKVGLLSLRAKAFLVTKTRFPTWILVATSASNALLTLLVFSVGCVAYLALAGRAPRIPHLLLYVVYVLHYVGLVMGFSLGASVLFLRYRDLHQVWEVVSQAGFFVAPIIFPLGILPERLHIFLYLWPPTPVIQFCRSVLVEGAAPTLRGHLCLTAMTLAVLLAGSLVYRRHAPRAAEYL